MSNRRIYEIARELGVPSRDVIERADSLGMSVTTASSSIDEEQLDRLMASYRVGAVREIGIKLFPLPGQDRPSDGATVSDADDSGGVTDGPPARSLDRFVSSASLFAVLIIIANVVIRISVDFGVVIHGTAIAIAVGFMILGRSAADRDSIPMELWLFAAMSLIPTIVLALATIQSIPSWAVPFGFVLPVGVGALWMVMLLPDRGVVGLTMATRDNLAWFLVALPILTIPLLTSFGEFDLYLGNSIDEINVRRMVVLLAAALVILVVYFGLVQGLGEQMFGRSVIPWVALLFASTFAASWAGWVYLMVVGLVLGALRTGSGSIWPGFGVTVLVFVSIAVF